MASVSPSSSVSRVAGEDRVGLEAPQAPSLILGGEFASADSGVKLRVVEAYYLALAKYYEVRAIELDDQTSTSSVVDSVASRSVSGVSSRSRRRWRRRSVESRLRRAAESTDEFEGIPELSYLHLVLPGSRYDARNELGRAPELGRLLACPREWFIRGTKLSGIKCCVGARTVVFGAQGVRCAVDVLAHVAVAFRASRGSFGAELYARADPGLLVDQSFVVDEVEALLVGESEVVRALGYCYLQLVEPQYIDVVAKYGPNLPIGRLLKLPRVAFRSDVFDRRVSVSRVGYLHVDDQGEYLVGQVLREAASHLVSAFDDVDLGAALAGLHVESTDVGVRLSWRVGADASIEADSSSSRDLQVGQSVQELILALAQFSQLSAGQFDLSDSALALKTAAFLDSDEKDRLRVLEAVGDNALSMVLAEKCLLEGLSVQEYQAARSLLTSNSYQAGVFASLGVSKNVQFASGVPRNGKVASGCFEVMVALIYMAGSIAAVNRFCARVGYFKGYDPWSGD